MLNKHWKLIISGLVALGLLSAGCIVSGTFVVNETFSMNNAGDFYSYRVDLTTDPTWEDHKDDIQQIEAVGFILYLNSSAETYFSAYVTELIGDSPDDSDIPATAKVVLDSLPVAEGSQVIPYFETVSAIQNFDVLKKLAKTGQFDFYGISSDAGVNFDVDSVTVVVTLGAG